MKTIINCLRLRKRPTTVAITVRVAVDQLESRVLFSTIDVVNGLDNNGGGTPYAGSLAAAITQANGSPGSTIVFSGLTAGTSILLNASLPAITADNTTVDGTTAPGGQVVINGADSTAFTVQATGFTAKGLWMVNNQIAFNLSNGSSNATIIGNDIGSLGLNSYSENSYGIDIDGGSTSDTIGGTNAAERNVISGNSYGIHVSTTFGLPTTTGNVIEGNYFGLDATGASSVADEPVYGEYAVTLNTGATGNTVQNNVFGGNYVGVTSTGGNTITNNIIGLNAAGTLAVPNVDGIDLLGGSTNGSVVIAGDTVVTGNTIEDNESDGIYVSGANNLIASNTITGNQEGIVVTQAGNTFSQNSIYLNTDSGIDLGLTSNEPTGGTTDAGPNGAQPYPVLTVADAGDGSNLNVGISLTSNPSTTYTIELYANAPSAVDLTGFGEGQTYVKSVTLTTGINGIGSTTTQIAKTSFNTDYISATATNTSAYDQATNADAGSTSQFAADIAAPGVVIPTISVANASAAVGSEDSFVVTLSAAERAAVTVAYAFTPGTATTADFDSQGGTLSFPAGTTQETIQTYADADSTGTSENFTLTLSSLSTNTLFSNGQSTESAVGTILPNGSSGLSSSISVGASSSSTIAGESITLTATVTGASGVPTGLVTFLNDNSVIDYSAPIDGTGSASFSTIDLPVGANVITAQYNGDSTYGNSTSSAITINVTDSQAHPANVALTASSTSISNGSSVTFTATVTGASGIPTGNVSFENDGVNISTVDVDGNGVSTLSTTNLPAGANDITAQYNGDSTYGASTSPTVTVNVGNQGPVASVSTFTASASTVVLQQSLTFTATVASATGGGPAPTGSIIVYQDGHDIGTYDLGSGGQVVITSTPTVAIPLTQITFNYSGDSNYTASASNAISQSYLTPSAVVPTITKAVVPPTVVAGNTYHAKVPISFTNTGELLQGLYQIILYLDTALSGLAANPVQLQSIARNTTLKPGKKLAESFNVKSLPSSVAAGVYYLAAKLTDPDGNVSLVTTSQSVTVQAPVVTLVATVGTVNPVLLKPGKSGAVLVIVTNTGNVIATGPATIILYPSSDNATALPIVLTKVLNKHFAIKPGKLTKFPLHFRVPTNLATGTYSPFVSITFGGTTITAIGSDFSVR